MTPLRQIAIAATFTAEPVAESLAFWIEKLHVEAQLSFAPYNQIVQALLDPQSALSQNREGVNVLLIRVEDWQRNTSASNSPSAHYAVWQGARDFVLATQSFTQRCSTPCFVLICPSSPASAGNGTRAHLIAEVEQWLRGELAHLPTVRVASWGEIQALYPTENYSDAAADELGHIPYTSSAFAAMGTMIARWAYGLMNPSYKVVVTDCDDVLWGGICGEIGPRGVQIDAGRAYLQEVLISQQDGGMLLCLCSKNNEADVWEVFAQHPGMRLRRGHLAGWRINWQRKSENIRALAGELNLGLDSFLFLDDSPLECAEVRANCPGVLVLQLPSASEEIVPFLNHIWPLDRRTVTEEDRKRTVLYQQNAERGRLRAASLTLADFLASLELKLRIEPAIASELPRVAQLTQRTNQFNCTTIRRSEDEIRKLLAAGQLECLVTEVSDRFGDYGLVGLSMFSCTSDALRVDTFLLSCRVLGRGVEHRMLQSLLAVAQSRELSCVEVPFLPTAKNQPAREFLEKVGTQFQGVAGDTLLFRFPAGAQIGLRETEEPLAPVAHSIAAETQTLGNEAPGRDSQIIGEIARELQGIGQILRAIESRKLRPGKAAPTARPGTPVERNIAAAWSEVLGITEIGVHDNFFTDLGGDSLQGTQVISRLRHIFQLPLELRVLFDAPTVAELAMRIVEHMAGREHGSELDGILAELEATGEAPSKIRDSLATNWKQ